MGYNKPMTDSTVIEKISATKFKATSLSVLTRVEMTKTPVQITRYGKPIAQIIPYPADMISSIEPEILSLQTNPELFHKYEDYRKKRVVFNQKFETDGSKRQKYYVRGEDSTGDKYPKQHQTDWKTKPFISKP